MSRTPFNGCNFFICKPVGLFAISSLAYCIHIGSRSGVYVYLFRDSHGYIIFILAFNFSADLSSNFGDIFYNSKK